jgi:hypothetical protein
MKKVMCLAACLALAACATDSQKDVTPVPQPVVQAPKPVSTVFRSWYQLRQRDVADARVLEDKVRQLNGVPIEAEIGRVMQKNDEGATTVVDIWKGINLGVPPTQMKRRTGDLQRAVSLVAEFAGSRSAQTNVEVHVATADKAVMGRWLDNGFAKSGGQFAANVVWKPLKKGDLPFIRVEPADSRYAYGPLS